METQTPSRFYVTIAVLVVGLILANFYFSHLGPLVPAGTGFIIFFVGYLFFRRERALQKMQYQFLTITTHNFRTPLAGIKWALDALHHSTEREERENLIQQIDTAIERILTVVEVLVGVTKSNDRLSYAFDVVSFRELAEKSLQRFSEEIKKKELKYTITADPDTPLIIADIQKIQFVVDVLVENAVKYSIIGGPITANVKRSGNNVEFSIHNFGTGLKRQDKRNMFTKFFRGEEAQKVNPDGLGLSLFISKIIVENHKGNIWVDGGGKKGLTFRLSLQTAQQGN